MSGKGGGEAVHRQGTYEPCKSVVNGLADRSSVDRAPARVWETMSLIPFGNSDFLFVLRL